MAGTESTIELTDAEKREVELVWNGKTRDVSKPPLEFTTALNTCEYPGRYQVAVKVIDLGNDTMTIVPVNVG
jgi:hypothetical protein